MPEKSSKAIEFRARAVGFATGPRTGWITFVFVAASAAFAALPVVAKVPRVVEVPPELMPIAQRAGQVLAELGLTPGQSLLAGVAMGALVLVARTLGSFARLLGADRHTALAVDDVGRALVSLETTVHELESQMRDGRVGAFETQELVRALYDASSANQEHESIMRLAASLDQIAARLERSIGDSRELVLSDLQVVIDRVQGAPAEGRMDPGLAEFEEHVSDRLLDVERAIDALSRALGAGPTPSPATAPQREPEPLAFSLAPLPYTGEYAGRPEHADEDAGDGRAAYSLREDDAARDRGDAGGFGAAAAFGGAADAFGGARGYGESDAYDDGADGELPPEEVDEPAGELRIAVTLDADFRDESEDEVPAPLPSARPGGLDLLDRLDSRHPLEAPASEDAPPLFPDLEWESTG